tara:strand:- start:929 stop:1267 length:339 start_codon:yes stop_codon:yes gene_type:complete
MKNRKVYVVDLDDTLCNTPWGVGIDGKEGPQYFDATPKRDRIEKINALHDDGAIIIIETARGTGSGKSWFYHTINQLRDWGLKFDHLRTGVKFIADAYIDDKGISDTDFFDG